MYKGIVEYFGPNKSTHPCGYCKTNKPDNSSYGLWAHEMTTDMYQILIDRNWRRSGKYFYKSILDRICCPMFAIRCEALNFKPSRSQRKIMKRFNNYIYHDIKPKSYEKESKNPAEYSRSREDSPSTQVKRQSCSTSSLSPPSKSLKSPHSEGGKEPLDGNFTTSTTIKDTQMKDRTKKAKHIRLQRRVDRLASRESCSKEKALEIIKEKASKRLQQSIKTFEDYFKKPDNVDKPAHKLEIKFVSTSENQHIKSFQNSHKLYEKYQVHVHDDDPSEVSSTQFKRFLCENPFEAQSFYKGSSSSIYIPTSYGAYHMQYWLDNELIVVGVLDILSHSVSSVYLYYDPKYSFLSLGTYSALREILLVRDLNKINASIFYYYLGYYIHSCPKMNYKGKFYPSFLLCDQALTWHPIEKCLKKLQHHSHPRFEDNPAKVDDDGANISDNDIRILYKRGVTSYALYKKKAGSNDSSEVAEYARLIGKKCTSSILLYRKAIEDDSE